MIPFAQARKNFSNIACGDFGSTVLDDISAQTVSRCEVQVATALQASAHCFFQQLLYEFCLDELCGQKVLHPTSDLPSSQFLKMAWHSYCQDATNGRDKYSTMLLDAAFINSDLSETNAAQDSQRVVDVSEATRGIAKTGWLDLATKISRTSDILPIDDETGEGCFAFSHKAFRSLGCPTPADFYYKQKLSNPNPHQQHGTTRG